MWDRHPRPNKGTSDFPASPCPRPPWELRIQVGRGLPQHCPCPARASAGRMPPLQLLRTAWPALGTASVGAWCHLVVRLGTAPQLQPVRAHKSWRPRGGHGGIPGALPLLTCPWSLPQPRSLVLGHRDRPQGLTAQHCVSCSNRQPSPQEVLGGHRAATGMGKESWLLAPTRTWEMTLAPTIRHSATLSPPSSTVRLEGVGGQGVPRRWTGHAGGLLRGRVSLGLGRGGYVQFSLGNSGARGLAAPAQPPPEALEPWSCRLTVIYWGCLVHERIFP